MSGGGGGSRVLIPNNVRRMIQDIKEIAGKHSDDDIYAMLKDCNMDPNETAQKLLYIDTFHEVKKKRDRKNVNVSNRSEEYRRTADMKGRSARGGRGGYSSPYVSNDAGGGKNVRARKENGVNNRTEKGSGPSMPVLHKTENNATTHPSNSSIVAANGPVKVSDESSSHGPVPQRSAGIYSSASDPVLDPSLNTQVPAVGAIKHEIGSQRIIAESSATLLDVNRSSTGQDIAKISPAASEIVNSTGRTSPRKSHEVEDIQMSGPSEFPSLPTDNGSPVIIPNPVTQSLQQLKDPSKVATEPTTTSLANSQPLPENESVSEEGTPDLDTKLEKLNISAHQIVVFPDHLQVPAAFKNQLTFGSLDAIFGGKDSSSVAESVHMNSEAAMAPSLSNEIVSSTTRAFPDYQQPPPHVPGNLKPLEDNVSSASVLIEQSKQEATSPPGGPQFPVLQSTPDYNFGIVPPLIGSHLVQLEGPELQAHDISRSPDLVSGKSLAASTSGLTSSTTQPVGVAQSSIPVSPQLFPFYQQPYPPNYFPYSPYFPHVFFSQNAHQFLGHSGFPQQSSTGNVYMPPPPPAAAATGCKLPVPSPYKLGTNAANLTHLGIPSGYGTYGSSAVGYSPNAAGSSASTEDLAASDLKEKSSHSTTQQGEDSRGWSAATGQDIPNLHASYFYNLPQGQHVAFSPAAGHGSFPGGLYHHPSQTTATPPTVRSLVHQSNATAGSVDSVVPPPVPYHEQPRIAQMNWNSTLLNREDI